MWSPLRFEAVCLLEYLATSCADDLGGHRRLVRLQDRAFSAGPFRRSPQACPP